MFGFKPKGHTFRNSEDDVAKPKPQSSIQRPQEEKHLIVTTLVESFLKDESELLNKYKKYAIELLEKEDLTTTSFRNNNYMVVNLPNDLIEKHFEGFHFENRGKLEKLKKSFKNIGIEVTDMEESCRTPFFCYSTNSDRRIVLHIDIMVHKLR